MKLYQAYLLIYVVTNAFKTPSRHRSSHSQSLHTFSTFAHRSTQYMIMIKTQTFSRWTQITFNMLRFQPRTPWSSLTCSRRSLLYLKRWMLRCWRWRRLTEKSCNLSLLLMRFKPLNSVSPTRPKPNPAHRNSYARDGHGEDAAAHSTKKKTATNA